jgi:hypothetical protein
MQLMTSFGDLLGPQPILLPAFGAAEAALSEGVAPARVAADHPTASVAWAALAEQAFATADGELDGVIAAYAYARTGYHRGLDLLRKNGWKGFGPVPWSHESNRGVLRCFAVLANAAQAIGEQDEYARLLDLLEDCDPRAARELGIDK